MFKKVITLSTIFALLIPQLVFAQGTLLPQDKMTPKICAQLISDKKIADSRLFLEKPQSRRNDILACAIKNGYLKLWMLPFFISYIANFFIGIAGTVSVLFVLMGGFWYMTGGLTDDKEKGKKTITYALIGLIITLLAWLIVNVVQVAVT